MSEGSVYAIITQECTTAVSAPADPTRTGYTFAGWSACPMHPYTDLKGDLWYHDGIHFCMENDLMNGISHDKFAPNEETSRAMLITVLWRLEGCPVVDTTITCDDVAEGVWYTEAVRWAASKKIVEGYGNGKFGTSDSVTREQVATIMYRYEQYKGGGFVGSWMFYLDYADTDKISSWAYEAMCWMSMNGVVNGKPEKILDPKGTATRAEVAAMMYRYTQISR